MFDKKYVYKLSFPNGMVYIGVTNDIKSRWAGNGCHYRGMRVYDAIQEYGWNNVEKSIVLELSKSVENDAQILITEGELIRSYGNKCYNVSRTLTYSERVKEEKLGSSYAKKYWEINGVTKSVVEWCREYGKNECAVIKRVDKMGLTPLQALTLPSVPNSYRRKPFEFWKAQGYLEV